MNLFKESWQTREDGRPNLQHILTEFCEVIDKPRGSARIKSVVESRDSLCHMTVWEVRKAGIGLVDGDRFPQRLNAVDDVAMTEARSLGISRGALRVYHYCCVIRLCRTPT